MSSNRLVFSGSNSDINTTVQAGAFQDGTHIGSGTPGSDLCGTNHIPNIKLVSGSTWSVGGAAASDLPFQSDGSTLIADTETSFRLHFNDSVTRDLQNGRIYTFNGTTSTTEATGVDAALWVKGFSTEHTAWTCVNSDSTTGPAVTGLRTGNDFQDADIGGNNSGEYYALWNTEGTATETATDHYYYCAISASPETAGGKSNFALGAYLEYY